MLTWAGDSATSDGGVLRALYLGPEDANYRWTVVVAPGQSTVKLPALPESAAAFVPVESPFNFEEREIAFIEAAPLPSYALFRSQVGALLDLDFSLRGGALPAMPAEGVYRASFYSPYSGTSGAR